MENKKYISEKAKRKTKNEKLQLNDEYQLKK